MLFAVVHFERCLMIRPATQAFLAAQVHYSTKWFNHAIDMGAAILVMSVALETYMYPAACMCNDIMTVNNVYARLRENVCQFILQSLIGHWSLIIDWTWSLVIGH